MTNKPMFSVELRVLGKAPLGERYYLCECPKCGWVGSSEECTQDEVLCLQKAGDDRCYGEADEIDAARLLELMQSGAFEKPAAQHQGEPVAWVIGTADGNGADYYPGKGLDTLEIGAKLYAEQPAPVAVVMPERMNLRSSDGSETYETKSWNAALDAVERLNGVRQEYLAACTSCDGSGDVVDALGDWRGYCACPAGVALKLSIYPESEEGAPKKTCAAANSPTPWAEKKGCPGSRKAGSLFCRLHQNAKSRTSPGFTPSNEALARMMRADGFQQ